MHTLVIEPALSVVGYSYFAPRFSLPRDAPPLVIASLLVLALFCRRRPTIRPRSVPPIAS